MMSYDYNVILIIRCKRNKESRKESEDMKQMNMRKSWIGALLIGGAVLLVGCGSKGEVKRDANGRQVLSGYITLSGAFALYPLAIQWADEFHRLHPDVDIDISAGGAGKGITDVLADQVDLAMVSRELKPQEKERGAVAYAVAKDAVVATVNADNPVLAQLMETGLKQDVAVRLWKGEVKTWGEVIGKNAPAPVNVYTRSDACGAAETWASFLDAKQEDLKGTGVFGDPGIAETLQKDVNGVGYNNIGYAYNDKTHQPTKGIAIVPIDVNGNGKVDEDERFYGTLDALMEAIAKGKYPAPPARNLYLVTAGKPKNPVVVEFLKYVRTKGQRLNSPAGFVHI